MNKILKLTESNAMADPGFPVEGGQPRGVVTPTSNAICHNKRFGTLWGRAPSALPGSINDMAPTNWHKNLLKVSNV